MMNINDLGRDWAIEMSAGVLNVESITFAITAFERPGLLTRLVHSILRLYPSAKIIVADNGRRKAVLPHTVKVFHLPFDCGLSAARNFLASKVQTPAMLLLEEDFRFLPTTRIEPLIEVLNHDPEVGVVGGAMMGGDGYVATFSMDIDIFRRTMYLRESRHQTRVTRRGTPYRICDVILNFALFRKEMLLEHRWDERLKVGEHTPYFYDVKKVRQWRVACCRESVVYHVPDRRSTEYNAHRQRAADFFQQYLKRNQLDRCIRVSKQRVENPLPTNPNLVVLGVGHSGTSILAKMLHAAAWEPGDADKRFGESVAIRKLNQQALRLGRLPEDAGRVLRGLPQPWAIKDPRFVSTLHFWSSLFSKMNRPPTLVMIRRDHEALVASYRRRNVRGDLNAMVRQRRDQCEEQFSKWPWPKMVIEYEKLGKAVELFRPTSYPEPVSEVPDESEIESGFATQSGSSENPLQIELFDRLVDSSAQSVFQDSAQNLFDGEDESLGWDSGSADQLAFRTMEGSELRYESEPMFESGSIEAYFDEDNAMQSPTILPEGSSERAAHDGPPIQKRVKRSGDGSL